MLHDATFNFRLTINYLELHQVGPVSQNIVIETATKETVSVTGMKKSHEYI